jgi:lipopolysaccharide export system protein LptA
MKASFAILAAMTAMASAATAPVGNALVSKSDSSQPINISSDSFQADLNGKTGTWQGNVVVVQGDMKLRANSVHMSTINGKADKVLADGNVVVDSPKSGIVTGDKGIYSVGPRSVLMTGNVVLKKGKDVMRGAQLTVNLNTGQANLGGGVKTGVPGQGGRVTAIFTPNSQN